MKVSIIIPIYRENDIDNYLKKLLEETKGFHCEVIVAVGLDEDPDELNNNTFLDKKDVFYTFSKKGRGIQLKKGVEVAKGDIIIFLHADTYFTKGQLEDILINVNRFDYGAFRLKINNERFIFRIIEFFVYIRTRLLKLPYGDQTIFIKRDKLIEIGGVKGIPLFEDVDLMRRCKSRYFNFYLSSYYSYTSDRRWRKNGVLKTTMKNFSMLFLYLIGVDTYRLYKVYYK